jgi:hypothetical protein
LTEQEAARKKHEEYKKESFHHCDPILVFEIKTYYQCGWLHPEVKFLRSG